MNYQPFIELDEETWERFLYKAEHYDWDKHNPPERLEKLRKRAKELGLTTRF
jgi:hypothetical protein